MIIAASLLKGSNFIKASTLYIKTEKRLITPERRNAFLSDLASKDWADVLTSPSVNIKVEALHNTINQLLDKHCHIRTVKERSDKSLWMTPSIHKLIEAKNKAYERVSIMEIPDDTIAKSYQVKQA